MTRSAPRVAALTRPAEPDSPDGVAADGRREGARPAREAPRPGARASQRLRFRVRYSETDQMGVVYHAHVLVWMEVGRTELLRALGHPYDGLEREGLLFPVSEVSCRFAGAARYGDVVTVVTTLARIRSRDVTFRYRIEAEDGLPVAEAEATVVAVDRAFRPRRIPSAFLADLRAARGELAPEAGEPILA